ncbi:hypothetical protein QJS10_CPB04g00147 [Acorus calamus]|uniref:LITAF domain-containing protein n=1 Tax=Acorus calamus TaxID=4465 RepID=A0AAV9F4A3_ACOCL|nr:hypothetical protein QJS10_CPB04g00147 [Acorus calamus]
MGVTTKPEEPAVGIPYAYPAQAAPPLPGAAQVYYAGMNPYQAGMIPPDAIFQDPKGVPLRQTFFRDSPAPFSCVYCGSSGLTNIKSKPSLAAVVGCMMPFMLGVCFLCPSMDCLWHKHHYCPHCGQKVADFRKSDLCIVVDPPQWYERSFALPA